MRRRALACLALALAAAPGCSYVRSLRGGDRKERREAKEGEGRKGESKPAGEGRAAQKPEAPDEPAERGVPPRGGRPRAPASPEGLLAPGAVNEIQSALAARGYLGAHRSGELDEPTARALRRFQESEGLAATGMPDRETLSKLGIAPDAVYGRDAGRR